MSPTSLPRFVRTETILDRILAAKAEAVAVLYDGFRHDPAAETVLHEAAQHAAPPRPFEAALRAGQSIALIAEIKRASPSKGVLIDPFDPLALAEVYTTNGAVALSILTDEPFFQGHLDHLRAVRATTTVPLLRKDFILDEVQIVQARAAGADAILLIAAVLDDVALMRLHTVARQFDMAALVEVHDETELQRALAIGASLIGVNNRDLHTFKEDLSITERLAGIIPSGSTLVAESAMRSPHDVARMSAAGAHAVLVGEGLLKAADMGAAVREFAKQQRHGASS